MQIVDFVSRKRNGSRSTFIVGARIARPLLDRFAVLGYRTATQKVYSAQARHICAAQLVGLVAMDGACGFYLITNVTAGGADLQR